MNSTEDTTAEIVQFFSDFDDASRNEDWMRCGDMFAQQFLTMDPTSATPVARDNLVAFLPHRKSIFNRAGATGTTLGSLDVEPLDSNHVLARTTWDVVFDRDHDPVALRSTFILRREDRWRIAVYLNHDSLLELLGLA
jgi:ketosteroid isomerase-like protein|nr:hypothetical protein [uncultured bacterium]